MGFMGKKKGSDDSFIRAFAIFLKSLISYRYIDISFLML